MSGNQLSRRRFVETATLAAGTLGTVQRASASVPPADVKIGLYSITYGGVWYRGDALTVEQVIERAKKFGYQGVEIDGKRPHGNPLDMSKARCQQLRKFAADRGIEIYAVAANNDFSSPIPEHRESQLLYARDLMRHERRTRRKNREGLPRVVGRHIAAARRRPIRHCSSGLEGRAQRLLRGTDVGMVPRDFGGSSKARRRFRCCSCPPEPPTGR
jgi:hypothetical protein